MFKGCPGGALASYSPLMTTPTHPDLFVPDEAAMILGCSSDWLAKERAAGRGPAWIVYANRVYYRRRDLDSWIDSLPAAVPARPSRAAAAPTA